MQRTGKHTAGILQLRRSSRNIIVLSASLMAWLIPTILKILLIKTFDQTSFSAFIQGAQEEGNHCQLLHGK
jgi:hypothetical protein